MSTRLSTIDDKYQLAFPADGQWLSDIQDNTGGKLEKNSRKVPTVMYHNFPLLGGPPYKHPFIVRWCFNYCQNDLLLSAHWVQSNGWVMVVM